MVLRLLPSFYWHRWLLCLCLSWGSTLPAHPLGDFFHQYGRKILIGVGTALGVTSTVAVGAGAYLAYELRHISRAVPRKLANDSGAKTCTAPQGEQACQLCQQHGPGQVYWPSARHFIDSQTFGRTSDALELAENTSLSLIQLFEVFMHGPVDPAEVIEYLPTMVSVSREQITNLLATPRYAPLQQKYPGLAQDLDAHFKL
ncbi:MAG: hypothetical protein OXT67_02310 [Zetaproteobacteria bacterium]|nr:hypothetical protein [Zetaproteobacteria bacterium]